MSQDKFTSEESRALNYIVKKYKCPKCGALDCGEITVSIEPFTGFYCLKCYAEWINKNIPKLEEM